MRPRSTNAHPGRADAALSTRGRSTLSTRASSKRCRETGASPSGASQPRLGVSEATIRARYARLVRDNILQVTGSPTRSASGYEAQAMVGVRTSGAAGAASPTSSRVARGRLRRRHRRAVRHPGRAPLPRPPRAARRYEPHPVARPVSSPPSRSCISSCGSSSTTGARGSTARRRARWHERDPHGRVRRQGGRASSKRFDDLVAVDGISVEIPQGSFFAMLGPSGLRQDDDAAHDRGLRGADLGRDLPRRPRRRRPAAVQARRQHRVPELRALPAPDDPRERRLRSRASEGRQGARSRRGSARCSSSSGSPTARA